MKRRFPLLVGVHAFWALALGPALATVVFGGSLTLYVVGHDVPHGKILWAFGFFGLIFALAACILPWVLIPVVLSSLGSIADAIRARACDVLLDDEGIEVVGGPGPATRCSRARSRRRPPSCGQAPTTWPSPTRTACTGTTSCSIR